MLASFKRLRLVAAAAMLVITLIIGSAIIAPASSTVKHRRTAIEARALQHISRYMPRNFLEDGHALQRADPQALLATTEHVEQVAGHGTKESDGTAPITNNAPARLATNYQVDAHEQLVSPRKIVESRCSLQHLVSGVDFRGADIHGVSHVTTNVAACCSLCSHTPHCAAFTFIGVSSSCWLKAGHFVEVETEDTKRDMMISGHLS